jgi:hypothetical protein
LTAANAVAKPAFTQVIATQHNLPSNSKRQLQFTAFVPEPHSHHQVLCSGLPTELQPNVLNSLSPSGQGDCASYQLYSNAGTVQCSGLCIHHLLLHAVPA